jgi:hypothetical protein
MPILDLLRILLGFDVKKCRVAEKVQPERKSITGEKLILVYITSSGILATVQDGK